MRKSFFCLALLLVTPRLFAADSLAVAPQIDWSTGVSFWQFVKVIFLFGVVLALLWVTLRLLRRMTGKTAASAGSLEVIGGLPLGTRRSILMVKVGDAIHLVGATDHHLSQLGIIDDPQKVAALLAGRSSTGTAGDSFAAMFRKLTGHKEG